MENYTQAVIIDAIQRTLHGDADAYGIIVRAYMNKLAVTARYFCGSDAYAEDLVQETFIDGYLRLYTLREPEKIEHWLTRILKNKAINYLTRTNFPDSDEVLDTLTDRDTPESTFIKADEHSRLIRLLDSLSPALRETARLYFLDQLSELEVADRQGLPVGTVKRRIHDARILLKKEKERMKENTPILNDSFAEELSLKIKELADYTRIYNSPKGFDSAYTNVKKLISGLSYKDDVREYELESAKIATNVDPDKYTADALAVYRKHGELYRASSLLRRNVYAWGCDLRTQINYTFDVVIPELSAYPESPDKHFALAEHLLHLTQCFEFNDPGEVTEAKRYWALAYEEMQKAGTKVNFLYALMLACREALELIESGKSNDFTNASMQLWSFGDGIICNARHRIGYRYNDLLQRFYSHIFNDYRFGNMSFLPKKDGFEAGEGLDEGDEILQVDKDDGWSRKFTVISTNETVETPAGTFHGCLHFSSAAIDPNGNCELEYHEYFKHGVGLVLHVSNNPCESKVLSSYEIAGGDGILPVAEGNVWQYVTVDAPDWLDEINTISVVAVGDEYYSGERMAALSFVTRYSLKKESSELSSKEMFTQASGSCDECRYEDALDKCKEVVILNDSRDSVDAALFMIPHIEERISHQKLDWRYMPSSVQTGLIVKTEKGYGFGYDDEPFTFGLTLGSFGTRHEENRIFGAKPWRYAQYFSDTLWDKRWVPGYKETYPYDDYEDAAPTVSVEEGGTVETPAGTFENTVKVTFECGDLDHESCYGYYFYNHTGRGRKVFWFAPGVGIVRFRADWGRHINTDTLLTAYKVIAKDNEMMPFHVGNYWCYDEQRLTAENYIARMEYKILSGTSERFIFGACQTFAFKGTVEEYDAFKESLK